MGNFKSSDIKIYPAANRDDFLGRLNLEYNITNLINRLTDEQSFIINGLGVIYGHNTVSGSDEVTIKLGECNIGGYFIKLINNYTQVYTNGIQSGNSYIVELRLQYSKDKEINNIKISELVGNDTLTTLDDETISYYDGLSVEISEITDNSNLSPRILEGEDGGNPYYVLPIALLNPSSDSTDSQSNKVATQLNYKIRYNLDFIEVTPQKINSSLSTNDSSSTVLFEDWLNKDFIIDDGEI